MTSIFKPTCKILILLLMQSHIHGQPNTTSKKNAMNNQNEKIAALFKKEYIDLAKHNNGFIGVVILDKIENFKAIGTRSEQANCSVNVSASFLEKTSSILKLNFYTQNRNPLFKLNIKYTIIAIKIPALGKERYRLLDIKEL